MLGTSTSFTPTCFLLISYFSKGDSFIWQTYNAAISRSFFLFFFLFSFFFFFFFLFERVRGWRRADRKSYHADILLCDGDPIRWRYILNAGIIQDCVL